MQKGIFYMAKEHLLLFSYESFLQKTDAKWRSFQSHFLSNLYYYGVQSLVCSPMNDKRMCLIYPIRMSLPTFVRCAFPLYHRRSGTPQQSSFPRRLPDLLWSRLSQSSSQKTSSHQSFSLPFGWFLLPHCPFHRWFSNRLYCHSDT